MRGLLFLPPSSSAPRAEMELILLLSVLTASCRHLRGNFLHEGSCLFSRWLLPHCVPRGAGPPGRGKPGQRRGDAGRPRGWAAVASPRLPPPRPQGAGARGASPHTATVALSPSQGSQEKAFTIFFKFFFKLVFKSPRAPVGSPCGKGVLFGNPRRTPASPSPATAFLLPPRSPAGRSPSLRARGWPGAGARTPRPGRRGAGDEHAPVSGGAAPRPGPARPRGARPAHGCCGTGGRSRWFAASGQRLAPVPSALAVPSSAQPGALPGVGVCVFWGVSSCFRAASSFAFL